MKLVCIYGPPAVGKLTVAEELGRLTSLAVWDNHTSLDCVLPIFPFGTESLSTLTEQIRLLVLEEAAREGVDVIFTIVFAFPDDVAYVEGIFSVVEKHGGSVCLVQLTCNVDEQEKRVLSEDRARRKKTRSLERVREWNDTLDLTTPIPNRPTLTIDTTTTSPTDVAVGIAKHYALPTT